MTLRDLTEAYKRKLSNSIAVIAYLNEKIDKNKNLHDQTKHEVFLSERTIELSKKEVYSQIVKDLESVK